MKSTATDWHFVTFPSELGWMALAGCGSRVSRLAFGQSNEAAARRDLGLPRGAVRNDVWFAELVERLQAYARGALDDFRDVAVDLDERTEFESMVAERCRQIPAGATLSYAGLAASVGRRGAARAVANVMRTNRVPIIIPCHRVVGSDGRMHGYSAAGGIDTKKRLLALELESRVRVGVADVLGAI
jgi:methylated-DNA-[protein]-cysteine S-methyltransferase